MFFHCEVIIQIQYFLCKIYNLGILDYLRRNSIIKIVIQIIINF